MDVRHLELLRELSVRGTLAAVAQATHRTPSAVSQQLKTAERELRVPLVEPYARGVRLTDAGRILAEGADEVLAALAEVRARLEASRGEPSGVVRIGTLPSAGEALLPGLVAALRGSAIDLEVEDFDLSEHDYAARTLDADIVIAHSLTGDVPAGAEALTTRVLAREPIDLIVPRDHPLAGRPEVRPRDLRDVEWIAVPRGYPFDTIVQAVEQATGVPARRAQRLRDNRLVHSLVAAGAGVALLPRFTTADATGSTVAIPLRGVRARRSIVALSRPDRAARYAVRYVTDTLATIGADLGRNEAGNVYEHVHIQAKMKPCH